MVDVFIIYEEDFLMINFEKQLNSIGIFDKGTINKTNYGLEVIVNEGSKLLFMSFFYLLIGYFSRYLFALAMLFPIRSFSGGLHMKTKLGCTLFSFAVIFLAVYLLPKINIIPWVLFIIYLVSISNTVLISPVKNPNRPIRTQIRYKNLKKKVLLFAIVNSIILFVLFINSINTYFFTGVWILLLNNVQLFTTWIYYLVKGEKDDSKKIVKEDVSCN